MAYMPPILPSESKFLTGNYCIYHKTENKLASIVYFYQINIFVFRLIEGRPLLAVRVWNRVEGFTRFIFFACALFTGAQADFFTTL